MLKKSIIFILFTVSLYATLATQENVTKLYVATFNRAPDSAGLSYWVNDSKLSLENIAKSFFDQPEAKEKYPDDSSNSSFIDSIYSNLFNRVSDTDGFNYWKAELDAGTIEKSVFILAVVNGAQNSDADILSNKTDVGLSYAEAGLNDESIARNIMINVTDNSASVTSALSNYNVPLSNNMSINNSLSSCTDTCRYANDGACDDGGLNSSYSVCTLGSDCGDCGNRESSATSSDLPSISSSSNICTNTCNYANDGACDDGGLNSSYSVCELGSDCGDCGSRIETTATNSNGSNTTNNSTLITQDITIVDTPNVTSTVGTGIIEIGSGNQQILSEYTNFINDLAAGTVSLDNVSDYNEYVRLLNEISNSGASTDNISTGRSIVLFASESDFTRSLSKTSSIENGQILAMIKVENLCKNTYAGTPFIASDLRTYQTESCSETTLFGETLYLCVVKATIRCSY